MLKVMFPGYSKALELLLTALPVQAKLSDFFVEAVKEFAASASEGKDMQQSQLDLLINKTSELNSLLYRLRQVAISAG